MENQEIKILVVDDEPDIIQFIEYNLLKEGFQVMTAANGLDALNLVKKDKPDLIILDIDRSDNFSQSILQDREHYHVASFV